MSPGDDVRRGVATRLRRIAAHAEALAVALPGDDDAERDVRIARLVEECDAALSRAASACGWGRAP